MVEKSQKIENLIMQMEKSWETGQNIFLAQRGNLHIASTSRHFFKRRIVRWTYDMAVGTREEWGRGGNLLLHSDRIS